MAKNLFRVNLTCPKNDNERRVCRKSESFRVSDDALSHYFDIHVLEVPLGSINFKTDEKFTSGWGRDNIVEWGNTLFVKPGINKRPFRKMLREFGYQKDIVSDVPLSEGGCYVFGDEFILIIDAFERFQKKFEKILQNAGLESRPYFVPDLIQSESGHIDCDYQIIDSLKLIYGSENLFCEKYKNYEPVVKARKTLEEIAKRHNYDVRKYKRYGPGKKRNGINSIIHDGRLFTGYIHPKEKEYLQGRGIEAITVPLGIMNNGSGLRCVYGEFNL